MPQTDTARIDNVNTSRIGPGFSPVSMSNQADRLREARLKAGYSSASAAARAFGWTESAYRHHENGTRPFDIETAKRYGRAFKVNPGYLLALDKVTGQAPVTSEQGEITVIGAVEAGMWREQAEWPLEDQYTIEVPASPIPGERFGLVMQGLSMDKTIQPGSTLECLRILFGVYTPQPGDLVIVERKRHDLIETTCKRLHLTSEGIWQLLCESTRPEFQAVIEIGKPDPDQITDDEYRVVAVVLRAYQFHFRR
jgi:SOS-response transcriptional repressor LexA